MCSPACCLHPLHLPPQLHIQEGHQLQLQTQEGGPLPGESRFNTGGGGALLTPALTCCLFSQGESGQPQSNFSLSITCQFCWQLDPSQYRCSNSTNCMTVSCPRRRYNATCEVLPHVHCLGRTCVRGGWQTFWSRLRLAGRSWEELGGAGSRLVVAASLPPLTPTLSRASLACLIAVLELSGAPSPLPQVDLFLSAH